MDPSILALPFQTSKIDVAATLKALLLEDDWRVL